MHRSFPFAQGILLRDGRALLSCEETTAGMAGVKDCTWKALKACFCVNPCVKGFTDWNEIGLSVKG